MINIYNIAFIYIIVGLLVAIAGDKHVRDEPLVMRNILAVCLVLLWPLPIAYTFISGLGSMASAAISRITGSKEKTTKVTTKVSVAEAITKAPKIDGAYLILVNGKYIILPENMINYIREDI